MTRTAHAVQLLARGPMTTAQLCCALALPSRNVWGLLKNAMSRGEVLRSGERFEINPHYVRTDAVSAAIRLLQRHGYVIRRSESGLCECDHDPSNAEWTSGRCSTCGKELD